LNFAVAIAPKESIHGDSISPYNFICDFGLTDVPGNVWIRLEATHQQKYYPFLLESGKKPDLW
jgi:hypothetical protein